MSRFRWDVYISYAGEDREFVLALHNQLQQLGLSVFVDRLAIEAGSNAEASMRTAAAEARIGVAILSEHYLRKKWPMSELSDFLSYQTCLPVLLGLSYQELQQIVREQSLLSQADQADLLRITMVTEDGGNQQHFLQRIAFEVVRILVTRECNRDRLGNTAADMDFLDNVITAATKVALLPELSGRRHDAATAWTGQLDETRKTLRQAPRPGPGPSPEPSDSEEDESWAAGHWQDVGAHSTSSAGPKEVIGQIGAAADARATVDAMNVEDLVDGLAEFLWTTKTSSELAVGIYGSWGAGKSSLMELVKKRMLYLAFAKVHQPGWRRGWRRFGEDEVSVEQLKESLDAGYKLPDKAAVAFVEKLERKALPGLMTVWFNAWQYTTAKETWAGLIIAITRQMEKQLSWWQRTRVSLRYSLIKRRRDLYLKVLVPILIVVVLVIVFSIVGWQLLNLLQPTANKGPPPSPPKPTSPAPAPTASNGTSPPTAAAGTPPVSQHIKQLQATIPVLGVLIGFFVVYRQVHAVVKPVSEQVSQYIQLPDHEAEHGYQSRVIDDLKLLHELIKGLQPGRTLPVHLSNTLSKLTALLHACDNVFWWKYGCCQEWPTKAPAAATAAAGTSKPEQAGRNLRERLASGVCAIVSACGSISRCQKGPSQDPGGRDVESQNKRAAEPPAEQQARRTLLESVVHAVKSACGRVSCCEGGQTRTAQSEGGDVESQAGKSKKAVQPHAEQQTRVVVFIDDLDRCSEECIVKVLEAVNLVLGACQFMTVMGIASDIVHNAIASQYKKSMDATAASTADPTEQAIEFAEKYLRKIVQVAVYVPACTEEEIKSLLENEGIKGLQAAPLDAAAPAAATCATTAGTTADTTVGATATTTSDTTAGTTANTTAGSTRASPAGPSTAAGSSQSLQPGVTRPTSSTLSSEQIPTPMSNGPLQTLPGTSSQAQDHTSSLPGSAQVAPLGNTEEPSPGTAVPKPIEVLCTKEELQVLSHCIRAMVGYNPREVKRFVNNHRLLRILMKKDTRPALRGEVVTPAQACMWAFLCWRYPAEMLLLLPKEQHDMDAVWAKINTLSKAAKVKARKVLVDDAPVVPARKPDEPGSLEAWEEAQALHKAAKDAEKAKRKREATAKAVTGDSGAAPQAQQHRHIRPEARTSAQATALPLWATCGCTSTTRAGSSQCCCSHRGASVSGWSCPCRPSSDNSYWRSAAGEYSCPCRPSSDGRWRCSAVGGCRWPRGHS